MLDLDKVLTLINQGERFLLTCHSNPDADALGSMFCLGAVLNQYGKQVVYYCPEGIPERYTFLQGERLVVAKLEGREVFGAVFVLDTASPQLLPRQFAVEKPNAPVVVIDHHAVFQPYGDYELRDVNACSTGMVVYDIAKKLGIDPLPKDAIEPLYTSIIADTGSFRYASTTPKVLRIAADLVSQGVDPARVAKCVFESWPLARLKLLAHAIQSLEVTCSGRFALMQLTQETLESFGAEEWMVDGLVKYAQGLRGVDVAALVLEKKVYDKGVDAKPLVKISLRSIATIDVASIAERLGGGGHRMAAGASVSMNLADAIALLRGEVAKVLDCA